MFGMVSVIFLSTLSGCDRNADSLIPNESPVPAVIEIGELEVVDKNTLNFIIDKQRAPSPHQAHAGQRDTALWERLIATSRVGHWVRVQRLPRA